MIPVEVGTSLAGAPALYAFSLGLVGAVNPCGFPLLPAYLVLSAAEARTRPLLPRLLRALGAGLAVTVGIVAVFGVLTAAIKAGVGVAVSWVPWVMIPLGVACVVLGARTAAGRGLPIPTSGRRMFSGKNRTLVWVSFGVTYAVASLSCALPIFLAGVAGAFSQRGVGVGVTCGVAYALGMGLVITAVSVAGASAQPVRIRRIRAAQPIVERLSGAVVAIVGAYLILYWVSDLVTPFAEPGPVRAVEDAQTTVSAWLAGSPRLVGALIGTSVVVVLAAASIRSARHQPRPDGPGAVRHGGARQLP